MKLINYEYKNSKYFKEGTQVYESDIKADLSNKHIDKLKSEGSINVRQSSILNNKIESAEEITVIQPIKSDEVNKVNKPKKPGRPKGQKIKLTNIEKLYRDKKHLYKVEVANKNKVPTLCLLKQSDYGYYVFIKYIDFEDLVKDEILKDLSKSD